MIQFKVIDEFTFDECIECINRCQCEGRPIDKELHSHYMNLLTSFRKQEKEEYTQIIETGQSNEKRGKERNTIRILENFIKKYSSLPNASKYSPQYIETAKSEINRLKLLQARKTRKKRVRVVGILLIFILLVVIGYKPVTYLNFPDLPSSMTGAYEIEIPSSPYNRLFEIETDGSYVNAEEPDVSWIRTSLNGDSQLDIDVTENEGDERGGNLWIKSYGTLFGIKLPFVYKVKTISIVQQHRVATYLNLSRKSITLYPDIDSETIQVSTDGYEWNIEEPTADWIKVYKETPYIEIQAEANKDSLHRSTSLRVYSGSIEQYIKIKQRPFENDSMMAIEPAIEAW